MRSSANESFMSTVAADGDAPRQLQKPFPKENLDGQKAEKLQGLADRNNMKFHNKLKKKVGDTRKKTCASKISKRAGYLTPQESSGKME